MCLEIIVSNYLAAFAFLVRRSGKNDSTELLYARCVDD